MAKQGAADIANFFSSFLEGYQTARGLKIAEEDRQRRIEREDFVFNQQLEAKEKEDAFAEGIQRAYKLMGHDDEVRQKFLQTKDLAKGINVPRSASGSYRADEPTDLLTDPDYLKYHSQELQKEIANLVSLNPNYNPKTFTDFLEKSDLKKATRELSSLSSVMFSNMSMEDKAAGLQPILQSMSGDKGLTVGLREYEVKDDSTQTGTRIEEKFVFTKSDGSVIEKSRDELNYLTDIVSVVAGANEEYDKTYAVAESEDKKRLERELAEITLDKAATESALKALELRDYPTLFDAKIKEMIGESSKDQAERIKTYLNKVAAPLNTNLSSAAKDYVKSKRKIGGDDGNVIVIPQFVQGGKTVETQYQRDTVQSVVNSIENTILEQLELNLVQSFGNDFSQENVNNALINAPKPGSVKNIFYGITDALFDESDSQLNKFFDENFMEIQDPNAEDGRSGFFVYTGNGTKSQKEKTSEQKLILNRKTIDELINKNKASIRKVKS